MKYTEISSPAQPTIKQKKQIISEASYPGNIGVMEAMNFFRTASPDQINQLKEYIVQGKNSQAWQLIQQVTGAHLQGKEFE